MRDWTRALALYEKFEANASEDSGACGTHCWMNENPNGCRYGLGKDCGGIPSVWPHETFDGWGNIVYVQRDGTIVREDELFSPIGERDD